MGMRPRTSVRAVGLGGKCLCVLGGVQGPFLQLLLSVETPLRVEKPKSEPVETVELVHPDSAQWSLDSRCSMTPSLL